MNRTISLFLAGGLLVSGIGTLILVPGEGARTADHLDPPRRTSPSSDSTPDAAADIADIYAWAVDGNLNLIITLAGPAPTDQPAVYDRDVLYRVHVSTDGDATNTEAFIDFRFGEDGPGQFGIQVSGIPGVGSISGPVEQTLMSNGARLHAGLFDDPFFFDSQGFRETRETGVLSFNNSRDFFANANVTSIVLQVPLGNFNATGPLAVWSESRRFGGQL